MGGRAGGIINRGHEFMPPWAVWLQLTTSPTTFLKARFLGLVQQAHETGGRYEKAPGACDEIISSCFIRVLTGDINPQVRYARTGLGWSAVSCCTATISAIIARAISSGVRLPNFNPIGPCNRDNCAWVSPACSIRSRLFS